MVRRSEGKLASAVIGAPRGGREREPLPIAERIGADSSRTGRGIVAAFIDSGFFGHPDLVTPHSRIHAYYDVINEKSGIEHIQKAEVSSWHGMMSTVVAAGNGALSNGRFKSLAPEMGLVLVKAGTLQRVHHDDIARAIEWVLVNRARFDIRILNISCGGDYEVSHLHDTMSRFAEACVRAGIVVVCAVGNSGHRPGYVVPPASVPCVISVGGIDDEGNPEIGRIMAYRSSYGPTIDGVQKPEIVTLADWIPAPILPETPTHKQARLLRRLELAKDEELAGIIEQNLGVFPALDEARDRQAVFAPPNRERWSSRREGDRRALQDGRRHELLGADRLERGRANARSQPRARAFRGEAHFDSHGAPHSPHRRRPARLGHGSAESRSRSRREREALTRGDPCRLDGAMSADAGADDELKAAEARVGETLGSKWRLDKLLGMGGMAAVYSATHKNNLKNVAVKVLHTELQRNEAIRTRFLREGYVANKVGHPGAVSAIDDGIDESGAVFLVMELLSGESLAHRVDSQGGKLPPREVLVIAEGILDVLASAHAQGVVHRDFKPDNMFVTEGRRRESARLRRRPRARQAVRPRRARASSWARPSTCRPSRRAAAPSTIDGRTDLWAVGAMMFRLIAGRYVHVAETQNEVLLLAMTEHAKKLTDVVPYASPEGRAA